MAKQIDYDDNLENLLKDEAEKAESLSILHRLSHEKYSLYSNAINIPVIVGSSAVGFMTGIQIDFDDINIKNFKIECSLGSGYFNVYSAYA